MQSLAGSVEKRELCFRVVENDFLEHEDTYTVKEKSAWFSS